MGFNIDVVQYHTLFMVRSSLVGTLGIVSLCSRGFDLYFEAENASAMTKVKSELMFGDRLTLGVCADAHGMLIPQVLSMSHRRISGNPIKLVASVPSVASNKLTPNPSDLKLPAQSKGCSLSI